MNEKSFEHRKSSVKLKFTRIDGTPLANQEIRIDQKNHEFLFGSGGFDAVEYAGGAADGGPLSAESKANLHDRLQILFSLNNYATLPFYWGRYEPEEGKPDEQRLQSAAKWFGENDITVKGHPLCWHTVCAPWLMNYSNEEILRKLIERIYRDVSIFKGNIDMWDVINEVVIMPIFDKYDNAITRVCKELGRVSIIREVFSEAKKANPAATLLLNDFNTSIDYEILIDGCLQAGIPIDVIGIQSHQHQGYWGLEKTQEVLERFSHFGLPIHFTENTILSGDIMPAHIGDLNDWQVEDWPSTPDGEERQAKEMVEMYETLFAHPSVQAITNWDGADGKWLGAPSGMLRKDNSVKPVYHALMKKIKGEWWTNHIAHTNESGETDFCGFRGEYTVSVEDKSIDFILDDKTDILQIITG